MVEYWLWSAIEKRIGSEVRMKGSQNCRSALGRDAYHPAIAAAKRATTRTAAETVFRFPKTFLEETFISTSNIFGSAIDKSAAARMTSFDVTVDKPVGRPGQEN